MPPDAALAVAPLAPAPAATPASGVLLRRILSLAAPTFAVALLQSAGMLAETWLAARQGTAALAGWAVVLPFALLIQMMSAGAMGGGVVGAIARALGANRRDEAAALVAHALVIALAAGLAFTVLLAGFPRTIFGLVGGAAAAEAAATYAILLFGLGAIPAWLANTLASVLRGGGRHALSARVMVVTGLAYPPLAWALMEPLGMGLSGAGLAMALTQAAAAGVQGWVVMRGGAGFTPRLLVPLRAELFARILRVGLVASALATVANLATILVTARIAAHGPAAVAAYGVSARLEFLMIPIAFGVGSALTALVGRAVGAGDWATARRTAWTGGLLAFGVTGLVGLFVTLFPGATARAFASDAEVVAIATTALSIIGPAMPVFGAGMAFYFASLGAGRVRWLVVAGLSRIALAVGGGWLLAEALGFGLPGQFLAVALGIAAYGVFTASAVRPGVWPGAAR
ncbi:MAG: multidrug transporter MatE [Acetobacteraceae bacterium]|nr:multidrug transporter MatE [Acetobacteraceae bacterium]